MTSLLEAAIQAHGGMERWRPLQLLGAALVVKGFALQQSCSIDVRGCRVVFQRLY